MTVNNFKPVQAQNFSLAGGGAVAGATSVILKSFTQIDGTLLTMTDFGTVGYATIEPGNGTFEEQIKFTGVTQNANGTATLTGVSTILMVSPYTATSGLAQTHAGSTTLVLSNTSGYYDQFPKKAVDSTISGKYTFPNDDVSNAGIATDTDTAVATAFVTLGQLSRQAISGASNASTTVKGIVQLPTQAQVDARTTTGSTGALLALTPDKQRTVLTHDSVTSAVGTDAYAITPTPAVTAYTEGDIYYFKADVANTGACSLKIGALAAIDIRVNGAVPRNNYIKAGQTVQCRYNATGPVMDVLSISGQPQVSQDGAEIYAASAAGTDTYAITVAPIPAAYVVGQVFRFLADVANTGAASLNVNGLGALTILNPDGTGLATGEILANQIVEVVVYDATNCKLLSPAASTPTGLFSSGTTTKNAADASTTQTIAHGLGVSPKWVTITAIATFSGAITVTLTARTVYNGTTQSSISSYMNSVPAVLNDVTFTLNATNADATQTGVVTVNSTNISIAWTKTGSPTGSYTILWEAEA